MKDQHQATTSKRIHSGKLIRDSEKKSAVHLISARIGGASFFEISDLSGCLRSLTKNSSSITLVTDSDNNLTRKRKRFEHGVHSTLI